jgi:hypothetical protein
VGVLQVWYDTHISGALRETIFSVSRRYHNTVWLVTNPLDTVSTTDLAIWSTIEVGLGVIAGSMATFRPLLRVILGKAKLATGYNNGCSSRGTMPVTGPWAQADSQKDLVKGAWTPMTIDNTPSPLSLNGENQSAKVTKIPSFIAKPMSVFNLCGRR